MVALNDEAKAALVTVRDLPPEQQRALVDEANKNLPKGDASRTLLWVILLGGLFVVAILCVVGGVNAANDKDAAPLFLIATAIVSGVLGLFATSPTGK